MQIVIGSKNTVKVNAVREVLSDYPDWANAEVHAISALSQVGEQPLSIEETVNGAKNRAEFAFRHPMTAVGIGLESGLMPVPTTDRLMDLCFCSIFDGEEHHLGMSCGFLLPEPVSKLIIEERLDLNQAMFKSGLTDQTALGSGEGAIGLLSRGRINRQAYTKQSVITAMIGIEQKRRSGSRMQPL